MDHPQTLDPGELENSEASRIEGYIGGAAATLRRAALFGGFLQTRVSQRPQPYMLVLEVLQWSPYRRLY